MNPLTCRMDFTDRHQGLMVTCALLLAATAKWIVELIVSLI